MLECSANVMQSDRAVRRANNQRLDNIFQLTRRSVQIAASTKRDTVSQLLVCYLHPRELPLGAAGRQLPVRLYGFISTACGVVGAGFSVMFQLFEGGFTAYRALLKRSLLHLNCVLSNSLTANKEPSIKCKSSTPQTKTILLLLT